MRVTVGRIVLFGLFLTLLLSSCDTLFMRKEGGQANTAAKFILKTEAVIGRTDGAGQVMTLILATASGIPIPTGTTAMCRTYRANAITVPEYSSCSLNLNTGKIPVTFSDPMGRFSTDVKLFALGQEYAAASLNYYVHSSLDGAALCPESRTKEDYFSVAASVLPHTAPFAEFTSNAPFYQFKFNAASSTGEVFKVATLRRSLSANANNTMALILRRYKSKLHNDCSGVRFLKRTPTRNQTIFYHALVFNASGDWVGIDEGPSGLVVTKIGKNLGLRFKSSANHESAHKTGFSWVTSKKTNMATPADTRMYLPFE